MAPRPPARDIDDILDNFWSELDPEDGEVASRGSEFGGGPASWSTRVIVGIAEVDGWVIAYMDAVESILGTWRADEPGAHDAALEACAAACDPWDQYFIDPELQRVMERRGDAPWMNGNLIAPLAVYDARELAEAIDDGVVDSLMILDDVRSTADLIKRLRKGDAPNTPKEREFTWDLTTALAIAEHEGRRLGRD